MNDSDIQQPIKKQPGVLYQIFDLTRFIVLCLAIVIPIRAFVAQPFIVRGESMHPTYEDKNYLIVDQLGYHFHEPERGDVVVFRYPVEKSRFLIKRIIGLPGETVSLHGTEVRIINTDHPEGFVLDEPYISQAVATDQETILGDTQYFVMGDNRPNSSDSRVWGPLDKENLVGRPWVRLLPLSSLSFHPGDHRNQYTNDTDAITE